MARITIKDLPRDMKISDKEMKQILGGSDLASIDEFMALKLQIPMERRGESIQILSNMVKTVDDTQNSIVSNLKLG